VYKKSNDGKVFAMPILERLRNQFTLLRRSNDPSLLLQAMLDFSQFLPAQSNFMLTKAYASPSGTVTVVDKALEIVDRYHDRILELEQSVLIQPKMKTVRESMLHLSSTVVSSLLAFTDASQSAYSWW
jgi:hypothetical protein